MNWLGDLRYAFRSLRKAPIFAVVAVASLALGIGANTAVFSLLDQVMLRSLPVKQAGQIVQLKEDGEFNGSNTGMNAFSFGLYQDIKSQRQIFSGALCRYATALSIGAGGKNERASGEIVSGTYFDVLGVPAAVGRVFHPEDDRTRSGAPYAVLSYDYWLNKFAGDAAVVGQKILINNHQFTIVGVSAKGFAGLDPLVPVQVFTPVMMAPETTQEDKPFDDRFRRWLQVFARLQPGYIDGALFG